MDDTKLFPDEIKEIFEELKSEIVWLHGRWIIFEQLYASSPERINFLNGIAAAYFRITQDVFVDDILMYIGRLTDHPEFGRNKRLSLGQIPAKLDEEKYPELIEQLEAQLKNIKTLSRTIRDHRNKKLAHLDINVALRQVSPLEPVTFDAIQKTLEAIRKFMNECELYFLDSQTAYEAFSMKSDGQTLVNKLKKSVAYEELEEEGLIEHGYWRTKSEYKDV